MSSIVLGYIDWMDVGPRAVYGSGRVYLAAMSKARFPALRTQRKQVANGIAGICHVIQDNDGGVRHIVIR